MFNHDLKMIFCNYILVYNNNILEIGKHEEKYYKDIKLLKIK